MKYANRYNEYVEYLKQIGEYDLEVEAMDLQTETQSSRAVIVGKGGTSEFGDDSILETVMANVLKKPFSTPGVKQSPCRITPRKRWKRIAKGSEAGV